MTSARLHGGIYGCVAPLLRMFALLYREAVDGIWFSKAFWCEIDVDSRPTYDHVSSLKRPFYARK